MAEVLAVASGKGGTGKTTSTLAIGMTLASEYDVTVVDADTGMANVLFHAGLDAARTTLHDLLVRERDVTVADATYERHGMRVVPCGTSLAGFEAADPTRLRAVVATLARECEVLLLDSAATLASRSAVLPVVTADRTIVVTQPTIPSVSDALKLQEYAGAYSTGTAGVVFNKVREPVGRVADHADRYFNGETLATVPACDAVRRARDAGEPLLAHAPDCSAATAFREAAAALDPDPTPAEAVADRFRSAVIPDRP